MAIFPFKSKSLEEDLVSFRFARIGGADALELARLWDAFRVEGRQAGRIAFWQRAHELIQRSGCERIRFIPDYASTPEWMCGIPSLSQTELLFVVYEPTARTCATDHLSPQ